MGKQLIELIKRELFAVIAVGMVMILLFGQAMASTPSIPEEVVVDVLDSSVDIDNQMSTQSVQQTMVDISGPAGGQKIFRGQTLIQFGIAIKGYSREKQEIWKSTTGVKNHGTYLQINNSNEVKILGVNNGTFNVWVKGLGKATINNTTFTFKTIRTINKPITINDQTITIKFEAGSQMYYISTLPLENASSEDLEISIPNTIATLPNHSTIILNPNTSTTFSPLVIITDINNKQMLITPGLLTWSSNNKSIASVDANGLVKVYKPGLVTVTVQVVNTNLIASTSMVIRPAMEAPLIDISVNPAVSTSSEDSNTETTDQLTNTTISNKTSALTEFVANLFNLKPSEAAKSDTSALTPSQTESAVISPFADNSTILTSSPGLITMVAVDFQKGFEFMATLVQRTISYLTSLINR